MKQETKEPPPESSRTGVQTKEQSQPTHDVQSWSIPARDAIEVHISDACNILIKQILYPGDDAVVIIHPDDVAKVCRLLRLAKAALRRAGHG